jgi:methionyl-tRNA formyltransferase
MYSLIGSATAPELESELAQAGAEQLVASLPGIIDGSLPAHPQDDSIATYCSLLRKEDSIIDPTLMTAAQAERQVRAYRAFPKTKVTIAGHLVVVTKAHISTESTSILDIQCRDGQFLSIDELIGPSGKAMNAKAFLNGYAAG